MADNYRGGRGYSSRDHPESHYPPPPGDEDDRRQPQYPLPTPNMAPVSSSYPPVQAYPPDPRYSAHRYSPDKRYQQDQRAYSSESPTNANGYNPPPQAVDRYPQPPAAPSSYDRRDYDDRRGYSDPYYQGQTQQSPPMRIEGYTTDSNYSSYRYPPQGHQPYSYHPSSGAPPAPAQAQPQAAPRQRTSIACRYCRKRKIRCSGYQNTSNGKCSNCDKLGMECIFQPVSSNSSAAFVPLSALGSVPPGTPLFGSFGQPLHASTAPLSQSQQSYSHHSAHDYPPLANSPPTSQYSAYDERDSNRRRTRDEDHAIRLPPPNFPLDDDPRRRSPASPQSNGTTPPTQYNYPPTSTSYDQGRIQIPHSRSPSGPLPTLPTPASQQALSSSSSNAMSLSRLTHPDTEGVDREMLGKLDRRERRDRRA